MSRSLRILLAALIAVAGCGREPEKQVVVAPPKEKSTLDPVKEKPAPPAAKPVVWPARELAKILDLGTLPAIENTKFGQKMASRIEGTVPANVPEAVGFYQAKMVERGWKPVDTADKVNEELGSVNFLKDGHFANLTALRMSPDKKDNIPQTLITFIYHGNFDATTLPRREGTPLLFGSPTLANYLSDAKVPDEAAWLTDRLKADGWEPFSSDGSPKAKTDDLAQLSFRKQGYVLKAFLVNAPAHGNKTSAQLSIAALSHDLPSPPAAADIRFDDARWEMKCEAPGTVEAVGAWYQKTMPAAGYTILPSEDAKAKSWTLRFGTDTGDVVMVSLSSAAEGMTRVNVYGVPKAVLDKLKNKN